MVDEVRSPVVELSASAFENCLPVSAVGKIVPAEFDFVNIAENAAVDDFADVVECGFQPAVVPEEQFARMGG